MANLRVPILVVLIVIARAGLAQQSPESGPADPDASKVLQSYVEDQQLWESRAARTSNCVNNATSVACMACSMDLPAAAVANGVAPLAVANKLWFDSERSAVCGMCMKVYMLNGTTVASQNCPNPQDPNSGAGCAGYGTQPYVTSVSKPLNYGAKVMYDPIKNLYYFIGMAVEWLDRNQTDQYTLAYPTQQTADVDNFGSWPIQYEGTACPGAEEYPMMFQFLDYSKPVTTSGSSNSDDWINSGSSVGLTSSSLAASGETLCNNEAGRPCGVTQTSPNALSGIKLQITGQRIPLGAVDIFLQDQKWHPLMRSGDGYWESKQGVGFIPDPNVPVDVRVACVDGSLPKIEQNLVPSKMLCGYQDPLCQRFTGTIQC